MECVLLWLHYQLFSANKLYYYKKYYKLNGAYYQRIMNIIALRKEENQMILDDVTEDIKNSNEPIIDLKEKKYAN